MPNHCFNRITVIADESVIGKLKTSIENVDDNNPVDFAKIVPGRPDDDGDWYQWSIQNWGTKWNSWNHNVSEYTKDNRHVLDLSFTTAWSPCEPITAALAKQWPSATFHHAYTEEGRGFSGWTLYQNGRLVGARFYNFDVSDHQSLFDGFECVQWLDAYEVPVDRPMFDETYIEHMPPRHGR